MDLAAEGVNRTHRGDIYRPTVTRDARNQQSKSWPATAAALAVDVNLQPSGGSLIERAFGREEEGTWQGFFPSATDLQAGDGFRVRTVLEGGSAQPARFEVVSVRPQGRRWDLEASLEESSEVFG